MVCSWGSTVMVIGRTAETIIYTYDGPVHLVTEIDGVRVISSSSHEMIQKVPSVVQKIFRINSIDPASYLLEASKQFQRKSHKADSYIDLVKHKLDAAIKACIDAASHEFDFETQKLLMRVRFQTLIFRCYDSYKEHKYHTRELFVRQPNMGKDLAELSIPTITSVCVVRCEL